MPVEFVERDSSFWFYQISSWTDFISQRVKLLRTSSLRIFRYKNTCLDSLSKSSWCCFKLTGNWQENVPKLHSKVTVANTQTHFSPYKHMNNKSWLADFGLTSTNCLHLASRAAKWNLWHFFCKLLNRRQWFNINVYHNCAPPSCLQLVEWSQTSSVLFTASEMWCEAENAAWLKTLGMLETALCVDEVSHDQTLEHKKQHLPHSVCTGVAKVGKWNGNIYYPLHQFIVHR